MISLLIPPGTCIREPDDIHRVTLLFPTHEDAQAFFEGLRDALGMARIMDTPQN